MPHCKLFYEDRYCIKHRQTGNTTDQYNCCITHIFPRSCNNQTSNMMLYTNTQTLNNDHVFMAAFQMKHKTATDTDCFDTWQHVSSSGCVDNSADSCSTWCVNVWEVFTNKAHKSGYCPLWMWQNKTGHCSVFKSALSDRFGEVQQQQQVVTLCCDMSDLFWKSFLKQVWCKRRTWAWIAQEQESRYSFYETMGLQRFLLSPALFLITDHVIILFHKLC